MAVKKYLKNVILLILIIVICLCMLDICSPQKKLIAIEDPLIVSSKVLLKSCIGLAMRAGHRIVHIKDHYNLVNSTKVKGKTKEGADEKMTMADLVSHLTITEGLKSQFPLLQVVSEEHNNARLEDLFNYTSALNVDNFIGSNKLNDINGKVNLSEAIAWVDPLDATQEFTEDLLDYVTVMICVAVKGRPIIGVIYKPFSEQLYWSYIYLDHVGLTSWHVPDYADADRKDFKHTIFILSRSHKGDVIKQLKKKYGKNFTHILAGGSGYKTLSIIEKEADAYLHVTAIKKWDICAPDALITAAGGKMTTLKGKQIEYSSAEDFVNNDGLLVTRGRLNSRENHADFIKGF